ncbi:MAG: hypothetical protein E7588_08015 [Ruminococcaceae bacterium]|nr:hypothetical protein [Oscillospiraceae bacterium]
MENTAIKNICRGVNKNSVDMDQFFYLPQGSFDYKGHLDHWIRFIEDYQIMNPELWKTFVALFRTTKDDVYHAWRIEYWGKMMRGASFVYQYTQNPELYKLMTETVEDLLTTQDELGRITTYSLEQEFHGWDLWGRKYVLLGLQYFLEVCKDKDLEKRVIDSMCRQTDYIMTKIGDPAEGKTDITVATNNWQGLNSVSILEPIVRLYTMTGEQRYFDFATYIVGTGGASGFNLFELAYEGKLFPYQYPVVKGYEMMSCFEGLMEYYRITKNEKYKIAAVNFAKRVMESDVTIIGCSGCTHELFDFSRSRQTTTEWTTIMQETCVTVTWMKFCSQVMRLTGEAWLAGTIETAIYNALIGAINSEKITENNGLPFDSYAPLLLAARGRKIGGEQTITDDGYRYGCCAAIGAAGMGLIPMVSCMLARDGIVMNMYIPGTIKAYAPSGAPVGITVDTKYPVEGEIKITVDAPATESFKMYIRIPEWSTDEKTSLTANGKVICTESGEYAIIEGVSGKYEILLTLDMRAQVIKPFEIDADKNSRYHVALRRGPIVMARDKRLGEDLEKPVDILYGKDGYVELTPKKTAKFDTLVEYSVPTSDGEITVIDFASAGKTWDEDSIMTVWMPTKKYWDTDITKPVILYNSQHGPFVVAQMDTDEPITVYRNKTDDVSAYYVTITEKNGKHKLSCNGKYLTVKNGEVIMAPECDCECQEWKMERIVQNRFRIYHPASGKYLYPTHIDGARLALYDFTTNEMIQFKIL